MRMIFNDLGTALSVKTCYSRLLSSSAVFVLLLLLASAFLISESENKKIYANTIGLVLAQNLTCPHVWLTQPFNQTSLNF